MSIEIPLENTSIETLSSIADTGAILVLHELNHARAGLPYYENPSRRSKKRADAVTATLIKAYNHMTRASTLIKRAKQIANSI